MALITFQDDDFHDVSSPGIVLDYDNAGAGEDIDIVSAANVPVARETTHIDWDVGEIEKGGYEHFMLKEIHEQPEAISNATRGRLLPKDGTTKLSGMQMTPADLAHIDRLFASDPA